MEQLTAIPIDYDQLRQTGYTETCDLYGEVIELRYRRCSTFSGPMYRVRAKCGGRRGSYMSHNNDDTFLRMACYHAIKDLKPTFHVHNDDD